jgi:hypothetical protein
MEVALILILALGLAGIIVGVLVPKAKFLAVIAGCILLYVVTLFAWTLALWVGFVSFDRLLAPVRWTQYERVVGASLYFGVPLLPPLLLLSFFAGRSLRRRKKSRVKS